MGGAKRGGAMGKVASMLGLPAGMPQPTPEQIAAMQKQMGQKHVASAPQSGPHGHAPKKLAIGTGETPKLPGLGGSKLPGLGGGLLSGLNPFGKKK
jgi:signal recognition particle subunit SRP54